MRGENFIYFSTVSGFFIGIIFAIIKDLDVESFLFAVIVTTMIFYLVALASVAFYVKYVDIKKIVFFDKKEIDSVLDAQIKDLEKAEDFIYESYEFIKKVEQEEIEYFRKNKQ
ncbi:hypothetical protein [Caminibacter sp.]